MARKPIIIDLPYVPLPDDHEQETRLSDLIQRFRSEQLVVFRLILKTFVFASFHNLAMADVLVGRLS